MFCAAKALEIASELSENPGREVFEINVVPHAEDYSTPSLGVKYSNFMRVLNLEEWARIDPITGFLPM